MTFLELIPVAGCVAVVAMVSELLVGFNNKISFTVSITISFVIIVLGSLIAFHVVSGSIAPQWKLSKSEMYAVAGTPTKSLAGKDKFIVILQSPGEKEYVYLVESIPPPGFKVMKNEAGQEFYVPEKFVPSNQ